MADTKRKVPKRPRANLTYYDGSAFSDACPYCGKWVTVRKSDKNPKCPECKWSLPREWLDL